MSPIEIVCLVAGIGYAIYRQTQVQEQTGQGRFKMAIIYGIVAVCVGGFSRPEGSSEYALLIGSLLLSIVVGYSRGKLTEVWAEPDGRVYSRGTPQTIGLFLGMVVFKFALGTLAYIWNISDDGGFGEILAMIAVMIAFQAEVVWQRARPLIGTHPAASTQPQPRR